MKNTINKKSGFTLLEIIIVIIIVGVLASLALPKFFQTVEFSRSTEALASMGTLRGALERCYLQAQPGNTYVGCTIANLDVANPSKTTAVPPNPAASFNYTIGAQSQTGYNVVATRVGGGANGNTITITQTAAAITRAGTTAYVGIK